MSTEEPKTKIMAMPLLNLANRYNNGDLCSKGVMKFLYKESSDITSAIEAILSKSSQGAYNNHKLKATVSHGKSRSTRYNLKEVKGSAQPNS